MTEDMSEASEGDSLSFESEPSWIDVSKDFITELRTKYPGPPTLWGYILIAVLGSTAANTQTTETGFWIQVTATILAFHEYLTYQVSLTVDAVSDASRYLSRINTPLASVPIIVLANLVFAYPMFAYGSYSDTYVELMVLLLLLIGLYYFMMFIFYFPLYWMGKMIPSNLEGLREVSDAVPDYLSFLLSLDQEPSLRRVTVVGSLLLATTVFVYHFDFFTVYLVMLFLLSIYPHTLELVFIIFALGAVSYCSPVLSSYAIFIQYLGRLLVIFFVGYILYFSIHLRLCYKRTSPLT